MFSVVPEKSKKQLDSILGKKFMGYASGNFSDFETQKQKGSTVTDYHAVDENDEFYRVIMEVEPNVDPLPCCKQTVKEQKCCRAASNSVRIATDVLQDTETESAESMSREEEMEH